MGAHRSVRTPALRALAVPQRKPEASEVAGSPTPAAHKGSRRTRVQSKAVMEARRACAKPSAAPAVRRSSLRTHRTHRTRRSFLFVWGHSITTQA
jgi:hypothetical protein